MSDPLANLVTRTEPRQRQGAIARALDPVRVGFLVDFWMPDAYLHKLYVEPILLAFEEAVARAEKQAADLVAKAKQDASDLIARHKALSATKIAAAERAAIDELRARAAVAATEAARGLIAGQHDADADRKLVDKAISEL